MSGHFLHAGMTQGVGGHSTRSQLPFRARTASPAVGPRFGAQLTQNFSPTALERSSVPPPSAWPTSQSQGSSRSEPTVQKSSSHVVSATSKSQAGAEDLPTMATHTLAQRLRTKVEEKVHNPVNSDRLAIRVDELKEKIDQLFADSFIAAPIQGNAWRAFREQPSIKLEHLAQGEASSVGGGSAYTGGTRDDAMSTCLGSEAESHLEGAVEAKVAAVLDVVMQRLTSFATSCIHRFQDELTRDREEKYVAVQEQIKKLDLKVEALRVQVSQVSMQEPTLMADTGASPSEKGLTTIYEDSLTTSANTSGQSSPPAKPVVESEKSLGLPVESHQRQMDEPPTASLLSWMYLPQQAKARTDGASEELASKLDKMNDRIQKAPGSPVSSQASRTSSDLQEVSFSKVALPQGGAMATTSSKAAYWSEAQIGAWYNETSKLVQTCPDPQSACQFIQKRWSSAEGHIPPAFKGILSQGLEEMKQKAQRYFKRNSYKLSRSLSPALSSASHLERKDIQKR